jgi:hypothetical protein
MAYIDDGLVAMSSIGSVGTGPGNVTTVYGYVTADALATVSAANYFNSAAALLKKGDIIIVSGGISGTAYAQMYVVQSNTGTVVAVTVHP